MGIKKIKKNKERRGPDSKKNEVFLNTSLPKFRSKGQRLFRAKRRMSVVR